MLSNGKGRGGRRRRPFIVVMAPLARLARVGGSRPTCLMARSPAAQITPVIILTHWISAQELCPRADARIQIHI